MTNPTEQITLCTRRQFFPQLLRELVVFLDTIKGTPSHQLAQIGLLPEETLRAIIPMVNPAYQIRVVDGDVCSQEKGKPEAPLRRHFPKSPENLAVFNRINGQHTLGEIGALVGAELGWDEPEAFAHVKALFLTLLNDLAVVPKNSHEWEVPPHPVED